MIAKTKSKGFMGLQELALGIIALAIITVIGMRIVSEVGSQMDANSLEANAAANTVGALAGIPEWMPIIIIAAVAGVVLTIVLGVFKN